MTTSSKSIYHTGIFLGLFGGGGGGGGRAFRPFPLKTVNQVYLFRFN